MPERNDRLGLHTIGNICDRIYLRWVITEFDKISGYTQIRYESYKLMQIET